MYNSINAKEQIENELLNVTNELEQENNPPEYIEYLNSRRAELEAKKEIFTIPIIQELDKLISESMGTFMEVLYSDIQYAIILAIEKNRGIENQRVAEYVDEEHEPKNYTIGLIDSEKLKELNYLKDILNQCPQNRYEELSARIRYLFEILYLGAKRKLKKNTIFAPYETPNKEKKALKNKVDSFLNQTLKIDKTYPHPIEHKKYNTMIELIQEFSNSLDNNTYNEFGLPFEAFDKFNRIYKSELKKELIETFQKYRFTNYTDTVKNLFLL